jgi:hypothetical protein
MIELWHRQGVADEKIFECFVTVPTDYFYWFKWSLLLSSFLN